MGRLLSSSPKQFCRIWAAAEYTLPLWTGVSVAAVDTSARFFRKNSKYSTVKAPRMKYKIMIFEVLTNEESDKMTTQQAQEIY